MTIFLLLIGAWVYGSLTFLLGLWWACRGKTQGSPAPLKRRRGYRSIRTGSLETPTAGIRSN
jgi:hypothetical protein